MKDCCKPSQKPQQGSYTAPSHQGYNQNRGVKKSQSGSVSGGKR